MLGYDASLDNSSAGATDEAQSESRATAGVWSDDDLGSFAGDLRRFVEWLADQGVRIKNVQRGQSLLRSIEQRIAQLFGRHASQKYGVRELQLIADALQRTVHAYIDDVDCARLQIVVPSEGVAHIADPLLIALSSSGRAFPAFADSTVQRGMPAKKIRIQRQDAAQAEAVRRSEAADMELSDAICRTFVRGQQQLYRDTGHTPDMALIECGSASVDDNYFPVSKIGIHLGSQDCSDTKSEAARLYEHGHDKAKGSGLLSAPGSLGIPTQLSASALFSDCSRRASVGSVRVMDDEDDDDCDEALDALECSGQAGPSAGQAVHPHARTRSEARSVQSEVASDACETDLSRRLKEHGQFSPRIRRDNGQVDQGARKLGDETQRSPHDEGGSSSRAGPGEKAGLGEWDCGQAGRVGEHRQLRYAAPAGGGSSGSGSIVGDEEFQQIQAAIEMSLREQRSELSGGDGGPSRLDEWGGAGTEDSEDEALRQALEQSRLEYERSVWQPGGGERAGADETGRFKGKGKQPQ
ncbi:hypothetical protein HK105_202924 [Polyrhizophydium stewartii]|uniref:Uncharacterized protein n=1 Tax=Polyrhizophydium stewartii TaxID=2732419 RepID=A0ABR4NDS2_9FUNG